MAAAIVATGVDLADLMGERGAEMRERAGEHMGTGAMAVVMRAGSQEDWESEVKEAKAVQAGALKVVHLEA